MKRRDLDIRFFLNRPNDDTEIFPVLQLRGFFCAYVRYHTGLT